MKRTTLSTLIALLVGCLASVSCTNTDNANTVNANTTATTNTATSTNTNTVVATTPTTASTPTVSPTPDPKFNLPYEAIRDTAWTSNPNPTPGSTPTKGTVAKGTRVFFDHVAPVTPTWQLAMFEDGSKKYVHPDDFKKL